MQWSDIQFNPSDRTLRQFAGLALIVFGGLALVEALVRHRTGAATAYGAAALVLGPLGLVAPRAIKPVFVGWSIVAFPIGWLVSTAMLAALWSLVFTPLALVFRLSGRDALALRKRQVTTYWAPKPQARDKRAYFHQS